MKIYDYDSFPFFYVPKVDFKTINLSKDTNIYIPINEACWAIKAPCVGGSKNIKLKKICVLCFGKFPRLKYSCFTNLCKVRII